MTAMLANEKDNLKQFLVKAKAFLKHFENAIGWKWDDNDQVQECTICPVNNGHRVPQKSIKSHVKRCRWREHGYSHEEINGIFDDEASDFKGLIIPTDDIISKIAPGIHPLRTQEMYVSKLTRDERLQIYDEIRARLVQKKQKLDDPFLYENLDEKGKQCTESASQKSDIELIKELRDHKRRRQSYRAKNVHVTKRSQTEILRDILSVHMEELRRRWNPEVTSPSSPIRNESRKNAYKLDPYHERRSRDKISNSRTYDRVYHHNHREKSYEKSCYNRRSPDQVRHNKGSYDEDHARENRFSRAPGSYKDNARKSSRQSEERSRSRDQKHKKHKRKKYESDEDSVKRKKKKRESRD